MRDRYDTPNDPARWPGWPPDRADGDPYAGHPASFDEPLDATRSAGLRRLARLTWRATQLGALATVGFATLFARAAPAQTVSSPPHPTPSVTAVSPSPSPSPSPTPVKTHRRHHHHHHHKAAPSAAPGSGGAPSSAPAPTLAPPTTAPAAPPPSPAPSPVQTTSSPSHHGGG